VIVLEKFSNIKGTKIIVELIHVIQKNKQYLSDIDGAIGDGDHGINMNKGFTLCEQELEKNPGNLAHSLKILSKILMTDIGGSMGPLYGMFFRSMANICEGNENINAVIFGEMLKACEAGVREIGVAEVGDKTMLDTLVPAVKAFNIQIEEGKSFMEALEKMKEAAVKGRDSTKGMVAKVGRASRLGERSKGVLDAGATSCCLIIESFADSIKSLVAKNDEK
jgi:dihydroxyacetone kinase-like protein